LREHAREDVHPLIFLLGEKGVQRSGDPLLDVGVAAPQVHLNDVWGDTSGDHHHRGGLFVHTLNIETFGGAHPHSGMAFLEFGNDPLLRYGSRVGGNIPWQALDAEKNFWFRCAV
jgi:hypothetical protein